MGAESSFLSSGVIDTSASVKATPGEVFGLIVISDGTNLAVAEAINGGSGGTTLLQASTKAEGTESVILVPYSVSFGTDIYLKVTGTNAKGIILYR